MRHTYVAHDSSQGFSQDCAIDTQVRTVVLWAHNVHGRSHVHARLHGIFLKTSQKHHTASVYVSICAFSGGSLRPSPKFMHGNYFEKVGAIRTNLEEGGAICQFPSLSLSNSWIWQWTRMMLLFPRVYLDHASKPVRYYKSTLIVLYNYVLI